MADSPQISIAMPLPSWKADARLQQIITRAGPCTLQPRRLPPFQALIHAIVHQQLSGKAAATIFKRFCALFPNGEFPSAQQILSLTPAELKTAGLSAPKVAYIIDLAEKTTAGRIPSLAECEQLSDLELIERLTQIKGIGRWTVEMLLIFNLGRPDVLPIHDLGIRRGFQITYRKRRLPEPDELAKFGKKWAPHRTTAAWYLWRAADPVTAAGWQ